MPELGPYGSVRGARSNSRPYRESDRPTVKTVRRPIPEVAPFDGRFGRQVDVLSCFDARADVSQFAVVPANRSSIKALQRTRPFDDVDRDRATGRDRAGIIRHVAGIAVPGITAVTRGSPSKYFRKNCPQEFANTRAQSGNSLPCTARNNLPLP